jgi:hypothetical protein
MRFIKSADLLAAILAKVCIPRSARDFKKPIANRQLLAAALAEAKS